MKEESKIFEGGADNRLEGKIVDIAETTLHSPKEILEDARGRRKGLQPQAAKIEALLQAADAADRERILDEAEALYRFANKPASDL